MLLVFQIVVSWLIIKLLQYSALRVYESSFMFKIKKKIKLIKKK